VRYKYDFKTAVCSPLSVCVQNIWFSGAHFYVFLAQIVNEHIIGRPCMSDSYFVFEIIVLNRFWKNLIFIHIFLNMSPTLHEVQIEFIDSV
jgi:hypothetical protein